MTLAEHQWYKLNQQCPNCGAYLWHDPDNDIFRYRGGDPYCDHQYTPEGEEDE
jgi:hypothetical protein